MESNTIPTGRKTTTSNNLRGKHRAGSRHQCPTTAHSTKLTPSYPVLFRLDNLSGLRSKPASFDFGGRLALFAIKGLKRCKRQRNTSTPGPSHAHAGPIQTCLACMFTFIDLPCSPCRNCDVGGTNARGLGWEVSSMLFAGDAIDVNGGADDIYAAVAQFILNLSKRL
jgi:hypothetical protein